MRKWFATGLVMILLGGISTAQVKAETIVLNNGDVLKCAVRTDRFQLHTPYGGIAVAAADIKVIQIKPGSPPGVYSILTVNNDLFSGQIFPDTIEVALSSGQSKTIEMAQVERLLFTYSGATRAVKTTLFFMNNGDLFTGDLLTETIRIKNNDEAVYTFSTRNLSRLEFAVSDAGLLTQAVLNDATTVTGNLGRTRFSVRPTSVTLMTPCITKIRKIQFQAQQRVLIESPSLGTVAYDADGDNVPDTWDQCPETACGIFVDVVGCAQETDRDSDGIKDAADLCPLTPAGLSVNDYGCWMVVIPYFDFDRAIIRQQDLALLDQISAVLSANPEMRVNLQGHTDAFGSDRYNQVLSERRSQSIKQYFVDRGIEPDRLAVVGYGETQPVATNDTEAGRAENRRVVVIEACP